MGDEFVDIYGCPGRLFSDHNVQAYITELTGGRGRICVGQIGGLGYDKGY